MNSSKIIEMIILLETTETNFIFLGCAYPQSTCFLLAYFTQ